MAVIPKIYPVYYEGDTVKLAFRVFNPTNVVVQNATLVFDAFPSGLSYVANYKDVGTYTVLTRTWAIQSIQPNELQTIYMEFEVLNFNQDWTVEANSTLVENADYPGETETAFGATVIKHVVGGDFQGFDTKEFITIQSTGTGDYPLVDSGIIYVLGTTTGAVNFTLPALSAVDSGFMAGVKVIDHNANTVKLVPDGVDTIEGDADVTLVAGDYIEVFAAKGGPINTWIVKIMSSYT